MKCMICDNDEIEETIRTHPEHIHIHVCVYIYIYIASIVSSVTTIDSCYQLIVNCHCC